MDKDTAMEQDEQQQRTEPLQTTDHQLRTQPMDIDAAEETMMTCPTSRTKTISGGCTNIATGDKCLKFGHQTHSIPGCNNTQEQHCDRPGNNGTDTRNNTQETTWTRNSASPDQTDQRETNKNAGNTTQTEESTDRVPLFLEDEIDQHKETEEQSSSNSSNIDRNREPDPDTTESSTTDEEELQQANKRQKLTHQVSEEEESIFYSEEDLEEIEEEQNTDETTEKEIEVIFWTKNYRKPKNLRPTYLPQQWRENTHPGQIITIEGNTTVTRTDDCRIIKKDNFAPRVWERIRRGIMLDELYSRQDFIKLKTGQLTPATTTDFAKRVYADFFKRRTGEVDNHNTRKTTFWRPVPSWTESDIQNITGFKKLRVCTLTMESCIALINYGMTQQNGKKIGATQCIEHGLRLVDKIESTIAYIKRTFGMDMITSLKLFRTVTQVLLTLITTVATIEITVHQHLTLEKANDIPISQQHFDHCLHSIKRSLLKLLQLHVHDNNRYNNLQLFETTVQVALCLMKFTIGATRITMPTLTSNELVVSAIHFILASKRTTKTCPLQEACLIRLPNCVKFTDTWRNVNELRVVTPWKSTAITLDWDPNENTE